MALLELRIVGLAVFASASLEPGDTLCTLTGETGSGKSLCIAALRLALGARSDVDMLRAGAASATVTAVFDLVPDATARRLRSLGVPDDDLLTVTREVHRSGRGACRINGGLVSLATLREVGDALVEVTGQGESHRLLHPARQRAVIDAFGGAEVAAARAAVADAVDRRTAAVAALDDARAARSRTTEAIAEAQAVVDELGPLGLRPGEDVVAQRERERLRHAAELRAAATAVHDACTGGDDAGAADAVAAAGAAARAAGAHDADVAALAVECEDLTERLRDVGRRTAAVGAALEVDDVRLEAVEERLDVLDRVRRRHGGSLDTALAALDRARRRLEDAGDGGLRLQRLEAELSAADEATAAAAALLTRLRGAAAARLEQAVTAQLRRLRLPHARFRVVLGSVLDDQGVEVDGRRVRCGPEGADTVEMRLAANRDGVPLPLDQGVSGGEMSRLALALRAVVALADDCPTLVLDEVDTGLGGETAARVGEVLATVGTERQTLVVTHRPEIAARAASHLVVVKQEAPGGARATVTAVEGQARVEEVARLMSGDATAAARARARELLAMGAEGPQRRAARTIAPR